MAGKETMEDFYLQKFNCWLPEDMRQDLGHFNVFRLEEVASSGRPMKYSRRDYYKISLIRGHNIYHYADKSIEISGTTLIFFNPNVPYAVEYLSEDKSGFFCLFKESFFTEGMRGNIGELPMFSLGGKPSYTLTEAQDKQISQIYEKMLEKLGRITNINMICCAIMSTS